ncbi:hypothetical protein EDB86DRAFT_2831889 [Lactarius hatsudake]|nr:hypothetical protein EDB86DRAFT_2831889 [Lactarius hatsudake]
MAPLMEPNAPDPTRSHLPRDSLSPTSLQNPTGRDRTHSHAIPLIIILEKNTCSVGSDDERVSVGSLVSLVGLRRREDQKLSRIFAEELRVLWRVHAQVGSALDTARIGVGRRPLLMDTYVIVSDQRLVFLSAHLPRAGVRTIETRSPYPPLVGLTVQPRPVISCTILRPHTPIWLCPLKRRPGVGGRGLYITLLTTKSGNHSSPLTLSRANEKKNAAGAISGADHRELFMFPHGSMGTIFALWR